MPLPFSYTYYYEKHGARKFSTDAALLKKFMVDFDDAVSIGKRYRRQDEVGTPFCITYDFDSEVDGCVTVRDRDTMQQERVKIDELADYISARIEF